MDVCAVEAGDDVENCFLLYSLMLNLGRLAILLKMLLSSCSTAVVELGCTEVLMVSAVVGSVVNASLRNFKFGSFKLDLISLKPLSVAMLDSVVSNDCLTTTFSFSVSEI